ncbi:TetR/AcrR family transcriptional regulator [Mycolicibacterium brisbanense]|uniref:TetR family transcriptional regulator n=1 Tax=Mycolicibacterium brisbanense TaxID=146020 RepID=A0A100W539_9MYCO|nr:TetR/AcrR family transcriptional regulator [Mycolicibacterium brisbanense]MCV7160377.1 TetR family transcriptional regulator [Mycolicibacterium brisbanense]GAS91768.1 TetR family transcriptional regulator [Mycolicibacterium brisbanense]
MPSLPNTRERLVSAAFELFEERGYEAASVDDIAARAQVGRTTAFRQFGSKEALIFPDHEALLRRADERLSTVPAEALPAEVIAVATSVFEHYLAEGDRARTRYRLTRSVPALRDFETAVVSRYARLFTKHLRAAQTGDWTADLRAELFANAVVAAHNHVLRRWLRGDVPNPRADLAEALAATWPIYRGGGGRTAVVVMSTDEPIESLTPRIRGLIGD